MSFGGMSPVFGKVKAELLNPPATYLEKPFLFLAHGSDKDPSALQVTVSDFRSDTFQTIKSRDELEDMRDDIGIGGSWSDFVDYTITSLGSSDVKLIMEDFSKSVGASRAKLIAQKAKGMPRLSIPLRKLSDGAAGDAIANLSLELYKDYKDVKTALTEEQVSNCKLMKDVAAKQEKIESLQKQLDMVLYSRKGKSQKINGSDISDSTSVTLSQDSPGKKAAQSPGLTKVNRVVPAFRRSKVRGAILQDTEDDTHS